MENKFIVHDINFGIGVMKEEFYLKFLIDIENTWFKRISSLSMITKGIEMKVFIFESEEDKRIYFSESKNGEIGNI